MAYVAKGPALQNEIFFTNLREANEYISERIIQELETADSFVYEPASRYALWYIPGPPRRSMWYDPNDSLTSYSYGPLHQKQLFHFCVKPSLKDRYRAAYNRMLALLPAQHAEAEKAKEWHRIYLASYDFTNLLYPPYYSGPGPFTTKYTEQTLGLPHPDDV